jgi:hypothetical protein
MSKNPTRFLLLLEAKQDMIEVSKKAHKRRRRKEMKKRYLALAALLLVLTMAGCTKNQSDAQGDSSTTAQAEAVTPIDGDKQDEEETVDPPEQVGGLSSADAKALASERIDEDSYTVEQTGKEQIEDKTYYIFSVTNRYDDPVGEIAIDAEDGSRYHYSAEEGLSDYSTFPLFNASVDAECDWNGRFVAGNLSMELFQEDGSSFSYEFSDGTSGMARVTGNAAVSDDGTLNFLYGHETIIVAGGYVSGNYAPEEEK